MSKWIKFHPHQFQTRHETVNCQRLLPPSSMQWTMKYLEDNWLSGVNRCLFSPRYLPFWSCRAWRLAEHNLSGLLNSMTWRKKTPVASQLRPLWSEKSSWQALNCCNAVWPTVIPNQFLSWLRTFSSLIWFSALFFYTRLFYFHLITSCSLFVYQNVIQCAYYYILICSFKLFHCFPFFFSSSLIIVLLWYWHVTL